MTSFAIATSPGFNFHMTIWSHGWYQLPPFAYDEDNRVLERVHQLRSGQVIHLKIVPSAGDQTLNVTVTGLSGPSAEQQEEITQAVRRCMSLDQDLSAFYEWLKDYPRYDWVWRQGAGRMMTAATVWEDLAKTLLTTNTTWNMTRQMCGRLCALGAPYQDGLYAFPTPERIAEMPVEELGERVRAGYRSAYLHELAVRIVSGEVEVETWGELDSQALYKQVRSLKGFGDYAASSMLRLMGHHDWLVIDSIARDIFKNRVTNSSSVTDAEIRAYYDEFGRWRGLVQWMDIVEKWLADGI